MKAPAILDGLTLAVVISLGAALVSLLLGGLLVYGVQSSLAAGEAQRELEALLAGHFYAEGLAFVAQGTPTNNTSAGPAGFPALDPDGTESYRLRAKAIGNPRLGA